MTLQLKMIHYDTKFGNKMFGGFEDISRTNSDNLTLCCDLDLESSNPFFCRETLAYDDVSSDQDQKQDSGI